MKNFLTLFLLVITAQTFAQTNQPPQNIAPAEGTILSLTELQKPLSFRWTPVIPKPQDPVTYRLTVWQLKQGQDGAQAMKANQPLFTKDVDNTTQAVINNLVSGPCLPPYLCSFIWNVQALNKEGKPIGENNGTSKPSQFSANSCDVNLLLKLKSVECLPATNGNNNYKICLSATYTSSIYNLTYSLTGSGFKAYPPSYSPFYTISLLTPALQVQNSGPTTTVDYCFNVSVPTGQTAIKIGLQGDDKDPGPIVCQPGAELDIRLPNCLTCACGTWGPLVLRQATGSMKYECGSRIEWSCNRPFQFTSSYQCSPSDASCQAKTTWDVRNGNVIIKSGTGTNNISDGFTLTANGTYTLTLNASCNGIKCPPCTYTIIINDCLTCACGTWGPLVLRQATGSKNYECGSKIEWSCNRPFQFTSSYQCSPSDASCQAKTTWEVRSGNGTIKSGTGTNSISDGFTLTANGTYTLTLNASCNGIKCPPCTYTIIINDCLTCDCGKWTPLIINRISYDCGSKIPWILNQPVYFATSYQCSPNNESCQAKTSWELKKDGVIIKTVSGTNSINDSFTPTANGTYTLTLNAFCNGKVCPPCTITVIVK